MRRLIAILALLAVALGLPGAARAVEMIRSFEQTIEIDRTDRLAVTETITVEAEGSRIRRGIYRDFPTVFVDGDDVRRQVGFSVESVTRDGVDEPWRTERSGDGVRIWIGEEDVFLQPGRYTYVIRYTTSRQLRRFADHDELFWNVTGNDWDFVIGRVEATVILPDGVPALATYGYTGRAGARGSDYRVARDAAGRIVFATTRMLQPGEGLSIVVEMPASTVLPPTRLDLLHHAWLDNQSVALAGGGFLLVLLYYLAAWWSVGRDPARGTVIPLFEPPEGISAPLAQYVHERGLPDSGFSAMSAAWVALAVKGLVTLGGTAGKDLSITRTKAAAPADLAAGEATLLKWLDKRGGFAVINKAIGKAVLTLAGEFRSAVHAEKRGHYFHHNSGWLILGILISVATIVAVGIFSATGGQDIASIVPLLFGSAFGGALIGGARRVLKRRGALSTVLGVVMGVLGVVLFAGAAWLAVPVATQAGTPLAFVAAVAGLLLANGLFSVLLPAATVAGRSLMDGVEGLILYMTVAEEKRLNMAGMPPVTPSRYETLLPYAIALGVEEPWTRALDAHLSSAAAGAADYAPAWYAGRWDRGDHRSFARSLGAMSSTFQSSVPAPKSTSSGRSGGSGGGGGGGGGGGW